MPVMTKMIYGTAWKKERTTSLVVQAVLHGFRAIDTACQPKHYREDLVGEALSILYSKHGFSRQDLIIQTKYTPIGGQDLSQPLPYDPATPIRTQILFSLATSLKNLRTSYLDSYLLHSPLPTVQETLEAWETMVQLKGSGQVRRIGVSNAYDVKLLLELSKVGQIDVVQNRWYEGNGWDGRVLGFCEQVETEDGGKQDGEIEYQSFWTLTGSPALVAHQAVRRLAEKKCLTLEQVVYAFAIGEGVTPISGTTSSKHMEEDVRVTKGVVLGQDKEEEELVNELRKFVWRSPSP
ncbi:hypothetical protein AX15_004066 [Amanita polypyramis BW_CC]|nr:hypothetical protein AX15_004066 [Amanita polypyramis BW_CC]